MFERFGYKKIMIGVVGCCICIINYVKLMYILIVFLVYYDDLCYFYFFFCVKYLDFVGGWDFVRVNFMKYLMFFFEVDVCLFLGFFGVFFRFWLLYMLLKFF